MKIRTCLLSLVGLLLTVSSSAAAQTTRSNAAPNPAQAQSSNWGIVAPGIRCGTPVLDPDRFPNALLAPSDCAYGSTSPQSQYDPGATLTIPVVVHVIQRTNGTGFISQSKVQSQIDVLNEDFLAIAGSNGANGNDSRIQFELASIDPNGNPTSGITYSSNNTWFNDGGSYWNTLAWDTNNYLNIYTNNAGGYLGYVPDLPQGGIVGSKSDRVVVLWSSFGQNGPIGPPYNKGRTTTHEVGHYLGLWHTFDGGCGGGNCYTSGDRICDTNPESSPTYGCPGSKSSCGSSDPFHNYMDYSDDLCMWEFSNEQINRMRCTLENWRPNLADSGGGPGSGSAFCFGDGSGTSCACASGATGAGCANTTGGGATLVASGNADFGNDSFGLAISGMPAGKAGLAIKGSVQQGGGNGTLLGDGLLCTNAQIRSQVIVSSGAGSVSLGNWKGSAFGSFPGAANVGVTTYYQWWYRDPSSTCSGAGFNLSNGWAVDWQ